MEDNKKNLNPTSYLALKKLLDQNSNAPMSEIQSVAKEYMKGKGISIDDLDTDVKVNPDVSKKVAQAYADMKHDPNDPKVKKAYEALANEIQDQYEAIQKQGFKASKITKDMQNPYKNSSELIKDIKQNKHMWYFPTESGFGMDDVLEHPMLKQSRYLDADGKPMPINDVFRIVHDYFGHAKDSNKFGATGEERAYLAHKQMLTPEAQKALATETRGQNSWVNYGPHGEANRANPANTIYAEQKAGLLPDWATKHVDEIDSPKLYKAKQLAKLAGKAAVPLALAGTTLLADDASSAIADIVVPGGVEGLGKGSDSSLTEEQKKDVEAVRQIRDQEGMSLGTFNRLKKALNK